MTRLRAVVFAALLVLSLPAASVAGPAAPAVPDTGDATPTAEPRLDALTISSSGSGVSWVTVGGDTSTSYAGASAGIGSSLGDADAELRAAFAATRIENSYGAAASDAGRQRIINQSVDDIKATIGELHEREQAAAQRYARGEITGAEFLSTIGRIHAEATALETRVNTVTELASDERARDIRLNGQLARFQTPMRADIAAALEGDRGPVEDIRIASNGSNVVMDRIVGSEYRRESVQYDSYVNDGPIRFESLLDVTDGMDVSERGAELYPWIYSNSRNDNSHRWYNSLMWVRIEHDRGTLQTFLDGTTRDVVLEYHELDVSDLETSPTVSNTANGIKVAAHRVPDGGPVRVNVTTPDGAALDANVTIDDHTVAVGDDGTEWIPARSGPVSVTATVGGDSVTVENKTATVTVR
ncbi:hypothetical protein SAMN06269185_2704 [Natronoarchaeum philippinense]|uniref:Uncharacterized protein n=1 Tax=Natronoarchaeum philippinense TaxID=558529 RepID=A0A285P316_NATPI|nr:hypothetical protein [Natronoarchaeum philippinense]SNZ16134.1 hypothetical protein SAMN06269185_2704 [Natronoarchaeum philippinense]